MKTLVELTRPHFIFICFRVINNIHFNDIASVLLAVCLQSSRGGQIAQIS